MPTEENAKLVHQFFDAAVNDPNRLDDICSRDFTLVEPDLFPAPFTALADYKAFLSEKPLSGWTFTVTDAESIGESLSIRYTGRGLWGGEAVTMLRRANLQFWEGRLQRYDGAPDPQGQAGEDGGTARPSLDPGHIMEVGMGFWASKTLLSAVELGLFTALGDESLSASELAASLGLRSRAVYDFLDGLVALGLLERQGLGADARYRNTPETGLFLDANSPQYVGGILEMANARLYRFWDGLTEALQTGRPQNEIKHTGKSMFDALYGDPGRLEQFMRAMSGISAGNFRALAEKFDFSSYESVCDVGGATGQLSIILATRYPHLRCVSFDLPVVEPIARRTIEQAGVGDRVATASGDFLAEPLPRADVITMGLILHDWNLERKLHLLRAAYEALPPGGALVVVENLIDDDRRENIFGLMMSLNMLIEFGDAFDFTGADVRRWCTDIGFRSVDIIPLAGPTSAAVAYK